MKKTVVDSNVKLRRMKEYLYCFDGKYYIVGRNECCESNDNELIETYKEFLCMTDRVEFKENRLNDINRQDRDNIADIFEKIQNACHVPIEKSSMSSEKEKLREEIEGKYKDEIMEQVDRWCKADICLTLKKGDKKLGI